MRPVEIKIKIIKGISRSTSITVTERMKPVKFRCNESKVNKMELRSKKKSKNRSYKQIKIESGGSF